jgi:hypothetical protein
MARFILGMAALAAGLSGCASPARYIEKSGDSGVVAIPANTNVWPTYYQTEAMAKIRAHVGPNFEIVEEREVATGKTTVNNEQVNNDKLLNKQTINNLTTTQDVTEWRIAYRKKASLAPIINDASARGMPSGRGPVGGAQPLGGAQPVSSTQPVGGIQPLGSGVQSAGGPISPLGAGSGVIPAVGPGPIPPTGAGVYGSANAFIGQMR